MNDSRFSPEQLARMRDNIKALASEGLAIRRQIQGSRGRTRHRLWNEKRRVGKKARAWLLVYGFARDIPYERIERRCHEGNRPQWYWLSPVLGELIASVWTNTELQHALDAWLAAAPSGTRRSA